MNATPRSPQPDVPVRMLGQSGCSLSFPGCTVYIDPYLSDSVRKLDAPDLERLRPIPLRPEKVTDADWVLLTHEHLDHCDPYTLPALADASPQARFLGPPPVAALLRQWGILGDRVRVAKEAWSDLTNGLRVHAVPAAHPTLERDTDGNARHVGYVIDWRGKRLYVAGDTSLTQEVVDTLAGLKPISVAMLPVNEQNFFRARRGIIGNMSVREAYGLANELEVEVLVPVHWDMFAVNSVDPEEMRAIYRHMKPNFQLLMQPDRIPLR